MLVSGIHYAERIYRWNIPCEVVPGDYFIRIGPINTAIKGDSGRLTFKNFYAVTVLSPKGGETWEPGKAANITWGCACWTGTVKLILMQNGSNMGIIAKGIPSTAGGFSWTVGKTDKGSFAGTGFKVRVVQEHSGPSRTVNPFMGESSNFFSIKHRILLH